ncbi:MAG: hypothetical protein IT542_05915 [Rubellimicrobium sp.]|nr:hypothetical protein [Rubellimicrobium sp.]
MVWRLSGALLRAFLVAFLVALPALILPSTATDTTQVAALAALVAGGFTYLEYRAAWPTVVEFRDAPPFNRIRFVTLFATVAALSLLLRGEFMPTTLTRLFALFGGRTADVLDFPYSPVRLVVLVVAGESGAHTVEQVRVAASIAYLFTLLMLVAFAGLMRLGGWPVRRAGFNVWVNLPVFDPVAGGDVVRRLDRDAQINLILGFLLPFLIPAAIRLVADAFDFAVLGSPHGLVWAVTAWAFLPAVLLMRGMALMRVSHLIAAQRRRARGEGEVALRHA